LGRACRSAAPRCAARRERGGRLGRGAAWDPLSSPKRLPGPQRGRANPAARGGGGLGGPCSALRTAVSNGAVTAARAWCCRAGVPANLGVPGRAEPRSRGGQAVAPSRRWPRLNPCPYPSPSPPHPCPRPHPISIPIPSCPRDGLCWAAACRQGRDAGHWGCLRRELPGHPSRVTSFPPARRSPSPSSRPMLGPAACASGLAMTQPHQERTQLLWRVQKPPQLRDGPNPPPPQRCCTPAGGGHQN